MVFYNSFLSKMLCISSCFRRVAVNLFSEFFLPVKREYISRSFKTCQAFPLTLVDTVDNAAVFGKVNSFTKSEPQPGPSKSLIPTRNQL